MSATFNTSLFANYFSKSSISSVESSSVYVGVQEKYEKEEEEKKLKFQREWGAKLPQKNTILKGSNQVKNSIKSNVKLEEDDGMDDDDEWVEEKLDPGRSMPI